MTQFLDLTTGDLWQTSISIIMVSIWIFIMKNWQETACVKLNKKNVFCWNSTFMTHIRYVELLNKVFSLDEICYPEFPMAFPSRLRGEILSYAANLGDHPIMSCRFLGPLMMYRNIYICVDATKNVHFTARFWSICLWYRGFFKR